MPLSSFLECQPSWLCPRSIQNDCPLLWLCHIKLLLSPQFYLRVRWSSPLNHHICQRIKPDTFGSCHLLRELQREPEQQRVSSDQSNLYLHLDQHLSMNFVPKLSMFQDLKQDRMPFTSWLNRFYCLNHSAWGLSSALVSYLLKDYHD